MTSTPVSVPGTARRIPSAGPASGRLRARGTRGRRTNLLFAVPAALFLIVFSLIPLFQLLRMSVSAVTSATLNSGSWDFVGADNLIASWKQGSLGPAFVNT